MEWTASVREQAEQRPAHQRDDPRPPCPGRRRRGKPAGRDAHARALRLAQERGYDLVEVAPMAAPPVARFLDYGQFKYEQARKEKEARRHQRSVEFKEIRLKRKIGKGDFDTKVRRAIQFLEDGDRVKVDGPVPGPRGEPRLHRAGPADRVRGLRSRNTARSSDSRCWKAGRCPWCVTSSNRPDARRMNDAEPKTESSGAGGAAARGAADRGQGAGGTLGDQRQEAEARAQDEEPQGSPEALRRDRQRQGLPRQGVARPPPRDQVVAPHPPLRRQGRPRQRQRERVQRLLPYL